MAGITENPGTPRWGITTMPQFEGKKALILNGAFFASIVTMFAEAGFERATTVDDADVVVFTGGVDVDPEYYGAERHKMTQTPNKDRDFYEKAVYEEALEQGKIMFGICRGFQFLAVMNGGTLWQDVDGHAGPDHDIYDCEGDVIVTATSYHHQMVALDAKMEVLAVCPNQISRRFESDTMKLTIGAQNDCEVEIEAAYWKDTKCLGVQGHPEVGNAEYRSWCMSQLEDAFEGHLFDTERPSEAVGEDIESKMEMWRAAALM